MRTVKEMARLTGVSVRTLHYYDEIGLLAPSRTTDAGYRQYDDVAVRRLQHILYLRELGFGLDEIRQMLDSPGFDHRQALMRHRELLVMQRDRLDGLVRLVDEQLKGDGMMDFKPFNMKEIEQAKEQYKEEAQARWGDTNAYKQSTARTDSYTPGDWERIKAEERDAYAQFVRSMPHGPTHEQVQHAVRAWKDYITRNYYDCTDEILAGLGEMYVVDERFQKNIDEHGEGLAQFMSQAIAYYCKGQV